MVHHGAMSDDAAENFDVIGTGRLEAFSDGVMAVIITIMAFDLKAPLGTTLHTLSERLPALLVYVLSFTFIGIYWNNHHHLLRATPRISAAVMWSNLLLLFWLSIVPVATEWVANDYAHPLPAATYGFVGLAAAISYTILVRSIIRANHRESLVVATLGSNFKGKISLVVYLAGTLLAFVSWPVAYALYGLMSLAWIVPDRRLARSTAS
jgi:uncharacterized membrane protein